MIKNLPNAKFRFSRRCLPKLTFFSPQEHNKMQELILPWIREGRHGWRDRFIFSNLIGLSAFSGLRPRELGQLRYNDFFFRNDVLCCNIRSRFTQRVIEFEEEARDYIKNLRSLRTEELRHEPLNNEEILYNSRIDKSPTDTRQSLLSLLKYAEIDIEKNGARRTVSSFRNLYAYRAIKRGKADYFIANQLNVSLRTVNEYRVSFENQESTQFGLNENSSDPTHLSPINWTNF